jgi:hypothetical protein
LKQVITEFILKIVVDSVIALVNKILAKIKGVSHWKDEYELSLEIVWLLYFQALIWITQIFFPFMALFSPLMLYALFKFSYFELRKFLDKPKKSSNASVNMM